MFSIWREPLNQFNAPNSLRKTCLSAPLHSKNRSHNCHKRYNARNNKKRHSRWHCSDFLNNSNANHNMCYNSNVEIRPREFHNIELRPSNSSNMEIIPSDSHGHGSPASFYPILRLHNMVKATHRENPKTSPCSTSRSTELHVGLQHEQIYGTPCSTSRSTKLRGSFGSGIVTIGWGMLWSCCLRFLTLIMYIR